MTCAGTRLLALVRAIIPLLFLTSCGYIGEPLPPLMNIPARVTDLAAVQRGAKIIVQFTAPKLTTEGVVLKHDGQLDARIGPKPAGAFDGAAWSAGAKPAGEAVMDNGRARYEIPVSDWIGKEVAIAVRTVAVNGRDAGWSNPVTLTVVAPPERPAELRAEAVPEGVHLTWQAAGKDFVILRRAPGAESFVIAAHSDKPEWTDTGAEFGKTCSYIVQSVTKAGQSEAQSDLSDEVQITPKDTFPPAAPAGLTAVPSTASIELVWERNTEPGIAGYRVYRALGGGPLEKLTDSQELPSYSDRKIEPGKTYRYAVTAVKTNGVESKLSGAVEATAP